MRTPIGSRWILDNYITRCHRRLEAFESSSSRSWSQLGTRCPNQLADWGLAVLSDPRLSSPARMRKKCCSGQKNFGTICGSLSPSPTHLSHITNINPFATLPRTKCERYIFFIKKCVRSFIEVVSMSTMFPLIFVYVLCLRLYNTGQGEPWSNGNEGILYIF